jgi:hypothetical protein
MMETDPNDPPVEDTDEMRPEYDFSGGVRGKYAERYADTQATLREIRAIQRRFTEKCLGDARTADEIIGYDEHGLPT